MTMSKKMKMKMSMSNTFFFTVMILALFSVLLCNGSSGKTGPLSQSTKSQGCLRKPAVTPPVVSPPIKKRPPIGYANNYPASGTPVPVSNGSLSLGMIATSSDMSLADTSAPAPLDY